MSGKSRAGRRYKGDKKHSHKHHHGKDSTSLYDNQNGFLNLDWHNQQKRSFKPHHGYFSMDHWFGNPSSQKNESDFQQAQLRSFEELQIERSYLVDTLQYEDFKATELLKHIRTLEDDLQHGLSGKIVIKVRRQLAWLKCRLGECTRQEKSILSRLGRVTYKIQAVERLHRIENERRQQLACQGMQHMRLDATCAEFTPHATFPGQTSPAALAWFEGDYSYGCFQQQLPFSGFALELPAPSAPAPPPPPPTPITTPVATPPVRAEPTRSSCPVVASPMRGARGRTRAASAGKILPSEKSKGIERERHRSLPDISMGEAVAEAEAGDEEAGNICTYVGYYVDRATG